MIFVKGQYDRKWTVQDLIVYSDEIQSRKRKRNVSRNRDRVHPANRNHASRHGVRR